MGRLYLSNLRDISIETNGAAPLSAITVAVTVGSDATELISESITVGFDGSAKIDLKDICLARTLPPTPLTDGVQENNLSLVRCKITAGNHSETFDACTYDLPPDGFFSDIDELRVPDDYIVPITRTPADSDSGSVVWRLLGKGRTIRSGTLSNAGPPHLAYVPIPASTHDLTAVIDPGDGASLLHGPVYHRSSGHFEQYMFANDYGGYDNIPMDGKYEYIPKLEYKNGSADGKLRTVSCSSEHKWRQNSGFQTRKTIFAMSRLICSRSIWHLKDGKWKQIVILSCEMECSSQDSLHSMTFEYRYVNED